MGWQDAPVVSSWQDAPIVEEPEKEIGPVRSFFTGEGRTEGFPELGTSGPALGVLKEAEPLPERYAPPGSPHTPLKTVDWENVKRQGRLIGGYTATPDPQATADIALKTLKDVDPDVSMDKDQYGNPTITFEGKTYYINAPGASEADFFTLLGQIGAYAPAVKLGAARNLFTRMMQTGMLAAGTSAGLDVAAGKLGSEQGIDVTRALITGATGALFEGLAPVVKNAWRTIFFREGMFDQTTMQLTQKGKELALQAGLDPEMMTRRLAKAFAKEVIDEPVPQLAKTRAFTEAYNVPFTRGQQMAQAGALSQAAREEAMRHGTAGFGDVGAGGMRQAEKSAVLHTRDVAEDVTSRLAGKGQAVTREAEAGDIIGRGLKRLEKELDDKIDDAYTLAGERSATLKNVGEIKSLIKQIDESLKNFDLDPQLFPATVRSKKLIGELAKSKKPITVRSLETIRRKLRANREAGANISDKKAVGKLMTAFDDWEDDAISKAMFKGDDDALALLKKGRDARVAKRLAIEQSDKFDDAGKIIQDILARDPSPEQVANYILGLGKLGKKQTTQKVAERLKTIFGEGSPEWNAVRESAWLRLMNDSRGTLKKPQQFVRDFDELMNRTPSLVKALYTENEVKTMRAIRDIMSLRVKPEGAINPSKTGFTLMRGMRDLIRRGGTAATFSGHHLFGGGLFLVGRSMPIVGTGAQQRAVNTAITQIPKPLPSAPPFVAGGIAGANVADPDAALRREIPGVP